MNCPKCLRSNVEKDDELYICEDCGQTFNTEDEEWQ